MWWRLNFLHIVPCVLSMVLKFTLESLLHWETEGNILKHFCPLWNWAQLVEIWGESIETVEPQINLICFNQLDNSLLTAVLYLHESVQILDECAFTVKLKRIWPLSDFLGVLPDHVVLAEDEERPVDGEAVLPDRNRVVQGHGAGTLRFGLLESWRYTTCRHGSAIAVPDALWPSIPWTQQARDVVSETGHSVKSKPHGRWDEKGEKMRLYSPRKQGAVPRSAWQRRGGEILISFRPSSGFFVTTPRPVLLKLEKKNHRIAPVSSPNKTPSQFPQISRFAQKHTSPKK